jgi:DNA modification methylase
MLVRQANYYYDADAVAEAAAPRSAARYRGAFTAKAGRGSKPGVSGLREFSGTRQLRDVWTLPSGGGLPQETGDFPALMPVPLAERCIKAASRPGDRVLDCFAGAGSTGVAAARQGRAATLIELSQDHAEVARRRLGKLLAPP